MSKLNRLLQEVVNKAPAEKILHKNMHINKPLSLIPLDQPLSPFVFESVYVCIYLRFI
jgi:hypothetical protein